MSDAQKEPAAARTASIFDRYTLPKVALAVILAASLVGVWVTSSLHGKGGVFLILAKWGYVVALGVLTGGLVWKHLFVRPADLESEAIDYCAEMYARFDRIALGAVALGAVGGIVVLWQYGAAFGRTVFLAGYAAAMAGCFASVAVTATRSGPVDRRFRSRASLVALGTALLLVVATAVAEVELRGQGPVAAGVRALHLLAFAVWLGGAVWNIFVAVPTGQRRPTIAVVRAAGEQLERFRWAVRVVIPTLLLTGLFQAVDGLGTDLARYLGSAVGLAVLAKVGFVVLLLVIFTLCPMWRACSPIEGVCDLEDLENDRSAGDTPTAGPTSGDRAEVTGDD